MMPRPSCATVCRSCVTVMSIRLFRFQQSSPDSIDESFTSTIWFARMKMTAPFYMLTFGAPGSCCDFTQSPLPAGKERYAQHDCTPLFAFCDRSFEDCLRIVCSGLDGAGYLGSSRFDTYTHVRDGVFL